MIMSQPVGLQSNLGVQRAYQLRLFLESKCLSDGSLHPGMRPLTSELDGLNKNGFPRLGRLIFPHEVNEILGWIDELGRLAGQLGVKE